MGVGFQIFIAIVIISAVVGAVAQFLNKINEAQAANQAARRPGVNPRAAAGGGGKVRTSANDIDRFLAEIDRLRKKGGEQPSAATPSKPKPNRTKPRVAAQPVEPPRPPRPERVADHAAPSPALTRVESLPVAQVVAPVAPPPQPAGRPKVTSFRRPQAVPKSDFGKHLAGLLTSPQAVPMAVALAEILGPPKCRKRG